MRHQIPCHKKKLGSGISFFFYNEEKKPAGPHEDEKRVETRTLTFSHFT